MTSAYLLQPSRTEGEVVADCIRSPSFSHKPVDERQRLLHRGWLHKMDLYSLLAESWGCTRVDAKKRFYEETFG